MEYEELYSNRRSCITIEKVKLIFGFKFYIY